MLHVEHKTSTVIWFACLGRYVNNKINLKPPGVPNTEI